MDQPWDTLYHMRSSQGNWMWWTGTGVVRGVQVSMIHSRDWATGLVLTTTSTRSTTGPTKYDRWRGTSSHIDPPTYVLVVGWPRPTHPENNCSGWSWSIVVAIWSHGDGVAGTRRYQELLVVKPIIFIKYFWGGNIKDGKFSFKKIAYFDRYGGIKILTIFRIPCSVSLCQYQ